MDQITNVHGNRGRASRRKQAPRRLGMPLALLLLALSAPLVASVSESAACPAEVLRTPYDARVFLGYACRDAACREHKDGFRWADRHGIVDARACSAGPDEPALREGCRAYADEAVTPEQAGFEWARENEIAEACLCGGAGVAFAAGCEAYVAGLGD